jgi:hypothetical protein
MKTTPLILALGILITAAIGSLQAKVVTLIVDYQRKTNEISIATSEVACVSSWHSTYPQSTKIQIVKEGLTFDIPGQGINGLTPVPQIKIAGPATLRLISGDALYPTSLCTFDIAPESFPPDKTLIIPAGTGANVSFECSTNLLEWTSVWQGSYTNVPSNKFFRIRADRTP